MRRWNKSQTYLPPKFHLPSVYSLRQKLLLADLKGQKLYFTTWDIKNFYWALKGPIIRFAAISETGQLQIWKLNCVPFGWDKACFLGQSTHLEVVNKVPKPTETSAEAYIDDGLANGPRSRPCCLH